MTNIAIINQSTHINVLQLTLALVDLQLQLNNEFQAAWGRTVNLYVPLLGQHPAPSDYQLILMDNYAQAGVLGYHELSVGGYPLGYVFYENALNNGNPWTVPASHEIMEMIMDPNCNLTVETHYSPYQDANGDQDWFFAFEVCDPVQDISQAYNINTTMVSNFVYPAWFQSTWGPFETQFDYQQWAFEPFQVTSGGAILVEDPASHQGWQEIYGDTVTPPTKPHPGSPCPPYHFGPPTLNPLGRRSRRLQDRSFWKRSLK